MMQVARKFAPVSIAVIVMLVLGASGQNSLTDDSDTTHSLLTFDCISKVPLGVKAVQKPADTMPQIGFMIGNSKLGVEVKYTPGFPFHISFTLDPTKFVYAYISAQTLADELAVGEWTVPSGQSGQTSTSNCDPAQANSLTIKTELGSTGLYNVYWIPNIGQIGFVEFQVTVVAHDYSFWKWNSFLCDSSESSKK